jgi:hypothetical protein
MGCHPVMIAYQSHGKLSHWMRYGGNTNSLLNTDIRQQSEYLLGFINDYAIKPFYSTKDQEVYVPFIYVLLWSFESHPR